MTLGTRSFPYPVLAAFNDDYPSSKFEAALDLRIKAEDGFSRVELDFEVTLTSEYLGTMLGTREATLVLDIFAKQTLFRQSFEVAQSGTISFVNGELFGTVEITPYLLAGEANQSFKPAGVHDEYRGATFSIEMGDVLAVGQTHVFEITPDTSSLPELMTVELATDLSSSAYEIDLSGSSILIRVGSDVMKYWEIASGDGQMKPNLFQGIYKDCIFFALQEIVQGAGQVDALWAKSLEARALEKGHVLSVALGVHEINAIALDLVSAHGLKKLLKNAEA